MKSFLRFISRNRLYTAIEVAGMAIALAFIVFIGTYVDQESSYDTFVSENVYAGTDGSFYSQSGSIRESLEGRFAEIRRMSRMIGTRGLMGVDLSAQVGDTEIRQDALAVDSGFLAMVPLRLLAGDPGTVLEQQNAVLVSETFANTWFPGGNAVGQTVQIGIQGREEVLTVTGIFRDMQRTVLPDCEMIYRLELFERLMPGITRNGNGTTVTLYELEPGADPERVAGRILEILKETDALYLSGLSSGFRLVPFRNIHYDTEVQVAGPFENIVKRDVFRLFASAGILLLVFALLNYISLTTAQVGFRAREMATRRLLGTGRGGIVLRYIGESLCITTVSFVLGFVLAEVTAPVFSMLIGKAYSPWASLSWRAGAMWAGVILLLSVVAGIIPAWTVSGYRPIAVVRGEFGRGGRMVLGRIFLVVQNIAAIGAVAMSLIMFLQLRHLVEKPMGYDRDGLVDVTLGQTCKPGDFLVDELRSQPFVSDVGWIDCCPASGRRSSWGFTKDGERYNVFLYQGDATAFRLLGIEQLSGSEPVYGSFYLTRRTAMLLGGSLEMDHFVCGGGSMPVCGVVEDFWLGNALSSGELQPLIWQVADPDRPGIAGPPNSLVVRVSGDVDDAVRRIRDFYEEKAPGLTAYVRSYEEIYRATFASENKNLRLVGLFAMLTIVLTVLAMVAMSTYYARREIRNVSIRKIMGCSRGEIYRMTLGSFLSAVLLGAAAAVPAVVFLSGSWLETYTYRIDSYWWVYPVTLLLIALTAVLSISYRAVQLMNTNPSEALRKE